MKSNFDFIWTSYIAVADHITGEINTKIYFDALTYKYHAGVVTAWILLEQYADLLGWALKHVEWHDRAESMISEIEEAS